MDAPRQRGRAVSPTTAFDHLMKRALHVLYPAGSADNRFVAPPGSGYRGAVMPDFVLPDGRWIDFKLHVSYREKHDVPWRPSALYASLRKYLDHPANPGGSLIVVYRHLHGDLDEVVFPIRRGPTVLVADAEEFSRRVVLVDAVRAIARLAGTPSSWILDRVRSL